MPLFRSVIGMVRIPLWEPFFIPVNKIPCSNFCNCRVKLPWFNFLSLSCHTTCQIFPSQDSDFWYEFWEVEDGEWKIKSGEWKTNIFLLLISQWRAFFDKIFFSLHRLFGTVKMSFINLEYFLMQRNFLAFSNENENFIKIIFKN